MSGKPKIYVFVAGPAFGGPDVLCNALAEDGHVLAQHVSSSAEWGQHDMGLTGTWKHDKYRAHYPDGYELVWLDAPDADAGFMAAIKRNQALHAAENAEGAA